MPWCETLRKYLLNHGFKRRKINDTIFINDRGKDFLLPSIYVDDIILEPITMKYARNSINTWAKNLR